MATKEELKSKLGQVLEQRQAERAEALAPVQAQIDQIKELIAAGDTRQAYRIFEELPILDQLAISLTPGVGDALAVYETGEFGTRAGERFEQDDILGGLGNVALSGLSGISLLPVVGPVADVAKTGVQSLTRVARTADDMPGGGGGALTESPVDFNRKSNEYTGTRAIDPESGSEIVGSGLISPNRKVLGDMIEKDNSAKKLGSLVAELRKKAPGKEGDLRQLKVIDDRNSLTPEIQKAFGSINKVTPSALDNYMFMNQQGVNVIRASEDIFQGIGLGNIGKAGEEKQRVYALDALEPKTTDHYNYHYPNTYAFDSTDVLEDGRIRLNRQQSDYDKNLQKLSVTRGQYKQKFDDQGEPIITKEGDIVSDFYRGSPFKGSDIEYQAPDYDEIIKDIEPLINRRDLLAAKVNKMRYKTFDEFFDADGNIKLATDIVKIPEKDLGNIGRASTKEDLEDYVLASREVGEIDNQIAERISRDDNKIKFYSDVVYDKSMVPEGLGKILDQVKQGLERYGDITGLYPGSARTTIDILQGKPNVDIGGGGTRMPVNFDPTLFGVSKYSFKNPDKGEKIVKNIANLKIEGKLDKKRIYKTIENQIANRVQEVRAANENLFVKDPFATKTGTNAAVLPTRHLVNELARETDAPALTFNVERMSQVDMFGKKKNPREQYANTVKEFEKLIKELELPKDTLKLLSGEKRVPGKGEGLIFSGEWQFDLDPVREALAEGKKISLMKNGGEAKLTDSIDSQKSTKVLPVRFTRLLQAAESAAEAMELGRSLGMQDKEILEELDMIEFDSLYRPNMLYGDFRDLTLEELQRLREREMEQGVIRGGDHIDSLLNKI